MAISNPTDIGTVATVANAATQSFNTTATVPSGGRITVTVGWFDAAATLSSITGGSLTWTIDHQGKNGSVGFAIVSADAPAGLASGTALQANYSVGTADRMMAGEYMTGVQVGASAAYSGTGQGGTSTSWASPSITVNAGDMAIGGSHVSEASGSPTSTAGGGNTETTNHDISCADGDSITDVYQTGTGASIAASGTWTGATPTTRSGIVAYRAASGGSYTPVAIANPRVGPMALRKQLARRWRQFFPGSAAVVTTYTDSGTGTITLSGSGTEAASFADSRTGTITLSGSFTQSQTHTASRTGTITLSGSGTDSYGYSDSRTGTITLSGSAASQSMTHTASRTGTVTLSGTGVEEYLPPGAPTTVGVVDETAKFIAAHT